MVIIARKKLLQMKTASDGDDFWLLMYFTIGDVDIFEDLRNPEKCRHGINQSVPRGYIRGIVRKWVSEGGKKRQQKDKDEIHPQRTIAQTYPIYIFLQLSSCTNGLNWSKVFKYSNFI